MSDRQKAEAEIPLEQMSDEQLDAALQANGLDVQAVLEHGFNGICEALLKKSEELIRAEAELAQIKERYATYRAAATAQAKLLTFQVEMLQEQLAAARNKALEEAAEVCDWLGAEASNYEGSAEDYRNYTFTELWAHRAYGQLHCAKAIRALKTPSDQGGAKEGK